MHHQAGHLTCLLEMNFCACQHCFLLGGGSGGSPITAKMTSILAAVQAALVTALGAIQCLLVNMEVP